MNDNNNNNNPISRPQLRLELAHFGSDSGIQSKESSTSYTAETTVEKDISAVTVSRKEARQKEMEKAIREEEEASTVSVTLHYSDFTR